MSWEDLADEDNYEVRIAWGRGGALGLSPIVYVSFPEPDSYETKDKLEQTRRLVIDRRRKDELVEILGGNMSPAVMITCGSIYLARKPGVPPPPAIVRWLCKKLPTELDLPSILVLYVVFYGPDRTKVLQQTIRPAGVPCEPGSRSP